MTSAHPPAGAPAEVGVQDAPPAVTAGAAEATTGGTVLRGGAWNVVALVLPQLFVVVASAAAARALGADLLGRQSFIAFVEITVVSLSTVGLPVSLMRTVASALGEGRSDEVRGLMPWAWRLLGVTGLVGGGIVAAGALVTSYETAAWLLAALVTFVSVLQTVPSAVLVGMQRWRTAATAGIVTGAVSTVAVVVVLSAGGGITGMFAVEAVVAVVNLVWTGALARRALLGLAQTARPARELRSQALGFARTAAVLAVLEVVVWKRSEFFFLARYSPSGEIAQYSIAFAAVTALTQLPAALVGVTSSFATLHGAGAAERIRSGFTRGARLILTVVLPLTAGATALGPATIQAVYGGDYARAGMLVPLLLVVLPFLPVGGLCDAILTGRGELRWQLRGVIVAVPVNLGLCLVLIPRHGALGAAIANVSAQLVATVPVVAHTWRSLGAQSRDLRLSYLMRTLLVAVVAGTAARTVHGVLPGDGLPALLGGIAGFVVVWLALARLLRVLSAEDGGWLAGALGPRAAVLGKAVLAVSAR